MRHLSEPAKIAIITKALNRGETPLKDIAKMNNVGSSTLNRWLRNYHKKVPLENKGSQEITVSEQFHHISATHALKVTVNATPSTALQAH